MYKSAIFLFLLWMHRITDSFTLNSHLEGDKPAAHLPRKAPCRLLTEKAEKHQAALHHYAWGHFNQNKSPAKSKKMQQNRPETHGTKQTVQRMCCQYESGNERAASPQLQVGTCTWGDSSPSPLPARASPRRTTQAPPSTG